MDTILTTGLYVDYYDIMKKLIKEFEFNGIKIKLYDEDLAHAQEEHSEATPESIEACICNPDMVIESKRGKNACLFYEVKTKDNYFVVVVHVVGAGLGEIRTAYDSDYIKDGRVIYKKEELK